MINATKEMREAFARDGAIKATAILNPAELRECRRCYEFNLENPGPTALDLFEGTNDATYNDLGTAQSLKIYGPALKKIGFADFLADLWGSEHVWYFGEELFRKDGGNVGRSPWHQDTPYLSTRGPHMANIWFSFETLPAKNALEVVKGSHLGTTYDGAAFLDPTDPTRPLWGDQHYPPLPDIEAERAKDPASWDVLSWDLAPGDAIVLHSGALQGGAPVDQQCPTRNTLVLRSFGDDVRYRPYPDTTPDYFMDLRAFDVDSLKPGDLFREEHFIQLR